MTSYDRVMTAIGLKEPDRVPIIPRTRAFSIKYAGLENTDCLQNPDRHIFAQLRLVQDFAFDAVTDLYSGAPLFNEFLGSELKFREGCFHAAPVFSSPKDFLLAKPVDLTRVKRMDDICSTIEKLKTEMGQDLPLVVSVPTPFRSAALLRGVGDFYRDLVANPSVVHDLLDYCLDLSKAYAAMIAGAGADLVFTSTSVANRDCISRKHYQEFVTAGQAALHFFLKSKNMKIIHHTCGDWSDRFDLVVTEGADVLFVAGEADLGALKQTYGDRVCLMGNVSSVHVMLMGTVEDVERKSLECIEKAGKGGGFILSADCELPPETPIENLKAMERSGKKFGTYPLQF